MNRLFNKQSCIRALSWLILVSLVITSLGGVAAPVARAQEGETDPTPTPTEIPPEAPSQEALEPQKGEVLGQALRTGDYPSQLVSSLGSIRANQHGPQRTDPAEGIPDHAYSPFAEENNRQHPCPPGGCEYAEGQVVVKFAPAIHVMGDAPQGAPTSDSPLNQTLLSQGVVRLEPVFPNAQAPQVNEMVVTPLGQTIPKPDLTLWHRAYLESSADVLGVAEALAASDEVLYAEPDYLRKPVGEDSSDLGTAPSGPLAIPGSGTDPLYDQQWHLDAANIPAAWQWLSDNGYEAGGSSDVVVAVIDTGVDYTHPDLATNMWVNPAEFNGSAGVDDDGNGYVDDIYGANVVSNQHSGDPQDDHGHGTHVAGIIAAQAENGIGGVGVAYNTQIMALKAAQYSGVLSSSDIAEAIYYAVEKGADVINMSFGGYARSQVEEDALAVAFGQAVLVAAAGNDGVVNLPCLGRDMYPAAYNWVLGVMASTSGGGKASFSNYDCIPHDSHEYELMAPGVDIWSTLPGEQYAAWDGTSMAAPVVSGIAALARTKWADKDVYSSRFIMGQISANTSGGISDAHTALTVAPKPELSYLEHWLFDTADQNPGNDDDGIVDAGEVIDLAIVIRNHWGKADPVSLKLEAWAEGATQPDPYVTMITDTVDYGAVGSFNQDDNGMIYNTEGVITGVLHPFRFSVDANTPNDHVIPFKLTMTARNGLDPTDDTEYIFQSRFYLIVQKGRELPRIISEDMTLTKDYYWIVPDLILIEPGVTLTVTKGTQIQWWSSQPYSPYHPDPHPYIQVEGNLYVQGTVTEPVQLFPSSLKSDYTVQILQTGGGVVRLNYGQIQNPWFYGVTEVSHSYLAQSTDDVIYWDVNREIFNGAEPELNVQVLEDSILHKLRRLKTTSQTNRWFAVHLMQVVLKRNLFDGCRLYFEDITTAKNNVFLKNHYTQQGNVYTSRAEQVGYKCLSCSGSDGREANQFRHNAILNMNSDPNIHHWMQFDSGTEYDRSWTYYLNDNYWSTTSPIVLDATIYDYYDNPNLARIDYEPILTIPLTTTYPFVVDVLLSTASYSNTSALNGPTPVVGAEPVTFTVTFNRDMATSEQPAVSFGPDVPETDYTIHPIEGGWVDPRTWEGTFNITPVTGDGYQFMRIAGAVAADDPWLVTGDDSERFRFEVITSGTESMNLQATGGEGYVDLSWTQDDFDLLSGFNLYRSTSQDGTYTRVNDSIIPPDVRDYHDTDVQPGQPYYYYFTIVKSDMSESDPSNIATATPTDTIPPVITHTPSTSAPPSMPLTLTADVTDNVAVTDVTLYYRGIGETSYTSAAMTNTTGDRYSATIPALSMTSPGVEYYLAAQDGVSTVTDGRPEYPHQVAVVDKPVLTGVSPDHGPASGGTVVTLSGTNFKDGASVTFGGAVSETVTVDSSTQITCTTPAHFPETVDVVVTNPDAQSGTLLNGFTYQSETASLSLPDETGGQNAIVNIPVNVANLDGLAAADLTVTFDESVLNALDASTGNLIPGWSMSANVDTNGEISLSMASPGGTVAGSGELAVLEFEVVGSPGAITALSLSNILLNGGAIPTETAPGSFQVDLVYDVSGSVLFWNGSAGVPNTSLTLNGDRIYTGTSDVSGAYTVSGAEAGDYTLTSSKDDEVNGITAYDASLVLQHSSGANPLSGSASTAGDVNKDGSVNSMDAFYILQKAVDLISLPFQGAGRVWDFAPQTRTYTGLASNQSGQDFDAILLGDPSGNWSAGGGAASLEGGSGDVTVTLPEVTILPNQEVTLPVTVEFTDAEFTSLDLQITYDPALISLTGIDKGAIAADWMLSTNTGEPGSLRVAMAGSEPLASSGEILQIHVKAIGDSGDISSLTITTGALDEGLVSAGFTSGDLQIGDLLNGCTFSGTVDLQGRSQNNGATFRVVGNNAGVFSITTNAAGAYELAVPQGTYQLTTDLDRYLANQRTDQSCPAGETVQLPDVTLLGGDANDDCIINILDLAFMGARFGTSTGDPDFDPKADINADGSVNILDLTVAGGNFMESCPVAWP